MTYASRNWRAIETPDLVGSSSTLTVTGEVQTTQAGQIPALAKAVPQGDSPATLKLNLSVTGGIGPQLLVWTPVVFITSVTSRQYKHVRIAGEGDATMPVEQILS